MTLIRSVLKKQLTERCIVLGDVMKIYVKNYNIVKRVGRGFTLIELMVVMTVIALLISIAIPRYFHSIEHAKEATLKQTLSVMRVAIDKFYGDNNRYPSTIAELVSKKYIRALPVDPITESTETWVTQPPSIEIAGEVFDIRSGAAGNAKDGTAYSDW